MLSCYYSDTCVSMVNKGMIMEFKSKDEQKDTAEELYEALQLLKNTDEMSRFFKDLCTPQEIRALAERWGVCRLLDQGTFSYREINNLTGASLATIGRIARFLKDEPHQGYGIVLNRMHQKKPKK